MKKCLAVLLAVLLLIGTAAVSVGAEEMAFQETSRTQIDGATIEITGTLPEGGTLVEAFIGGAACAVTPKAENAFMVSLAEVPTGLYTKITYGYTVGSTPNTTAVEGDPIVVGGRLEVTLTAAFNADGTLTVTATDANDMPAREYKVKLTLEGMPEEGVTNSKGRYTSTFRVSEGKDATFLGLETGYRDTPLIYEASAKQSLTRQTPTTTTIATTTAIGETTTTVSEETTTSVSEDTTTTTEQQAGATTATTVSTTATVKGDSTTALQNGMIAMNSLTDTALLEAFGLTRQDFLSKARLLIAEADYQSLVGRTGNVPMLSVRTSTAKITPTMVQTALTNVSQFSKYAEDQRQVLTFDLSLLMLSRTGKEVPITALPDDILYTIQLPVPHAMKKCTAFAVTVMDGDRLMTPQAVEVKNGMFELTINSLEAYTLIGFGEESEGTAGGLSWRLVVLLIAGILLIAGAGVLLYLFVLRKPEAVESNNVQTTLPDNDTDIFSGRTDMENTWEPEDN